MRGGEQREVNDSLQDDELDSAGADDEQRRNGEVQTTKVEGLSS